MVEENRAYDQIIDNPAAPYINELASRGALFTRSYAVTHPSQPNYLALFAGSTYGVTSNACPLELRGPNLASRLMDRGLSFAAYADALPATSAPDCSHGAYRRKHNPVAAWTELAAVNLPFSAFPQDFSQLPTVSWVVPDQRHDMHDGTVAQGDAWLKRRLSAYADWAVHHNSLLIITWDEDDRSADNRIATVFVGQSVRRGRSSRRIDHYDVLRTIEAMYGLPPVNNTVQARAIDEVWVDAPP